MNTPTNHSDTDLSSDSSWTFVNDAANNSRKNSSEKVSIEIPNDVDRQEHVEKCRQYFENLERDKENVKQNEHIDGLDDSFLTFDEFSLERMTENGEIKPNLKKNKKKNKTSKKGCADPMNLLSIFACLLTITGITLLTTFLPPNVETAEVENFQNHITEIMERSTNPSRENAVKSLHETADTIEVAKRINLFDMVENMSENSTDEEICDAAFEQFSNTTWVPDQTSKLRIPILSPILQDMFKEEVPKENEIDIREQLKTTTKSLFDIVKGLVKSPGLQMFVATLIQDICLIKLINEFSKRVSDVSEKEDKDETKMVKKVVKKVKKITGGGKKKIENTGSNEKRENGLKKNKSPKNLKKPLSDEQIIKKLSSIYHDDSKNDANENGKSECERRFEELDTRWETLGQNHRQKIQQIKSKFQKEIIQIKEQEKETYGRKQKISFTREKFIQRLKADREVYLYKLRKLREERQKILDEVCHNFRNSRDSNPKDASVGNYAVLLPGNYNFQKKLQDLKEKECFKVGEGLESRRIKLEVVNNTGISIVPDTVGEEATVKTDIIDVDTKRMLQDHTDKYCELKRKYLKKKARLIKKRQAKKDAREVQSVVNNILNSLSEATSKSLMKNASHENGLIKPQSPTKGEANETDFQVVYRKKSNKRNLNNMYDVAFEGNSKKIKQSDMMKWKKDNDAWRNTSQHQEILMSKQDPLKSHKAKITHKGIL